MILRLILALALSGPALANAPDDSLRPVARDRQAAPQAPAITVQRAGTEDLRPVSRPPFDVVVTRYSVQSEHPYPTRRPTHPLDGFLVQAAVIRPAADATHPEARPAGLRDLFGGGNRKSRNGSVCGVRAIRGTPMNDIGNPGGGCGVDDPVRVTEVSGVRLSTPATIDCTTAKALNTWVSKGLKPAMKRKGGGIAELKVAAHYACRTRNNRPGGRLSEHARGHAVDISGVRLKDGTHVTVLNHWSGKKYGNALKSAHKAACGPFGTVLGPNADRYHRDHFHFDTARYRSGPYCR